MKASPLHYQGVVRDEEDEAGNSTHAGGAYAGPTELKDRSSASTESRTAARGSLLSTLLVLILVIVSIISVVYIEDISDSVRDLNSDEPGGFSTSTLQSLQTSTASYTSSPSLYSDHGNSLYIRIPASIIDSNTDILLVEQLTSGIGSRDLFWDAGTVVSQDIVQFRSAGVGKLELIHMQQSYRGDLDLMHRSFPNSVFWSFDILDTNNAGVLIQLDQFALSGIGNRHGNDISTVLAGVYGAQYVYVVDLTRSRLNTQTSGSNEFRTVIDRSITYALSSSALIPPPAAVDRQFTLTARRSFILLDRYYRLQSEHMGQIQYDVYRPRPFHPMSGLNAVNFMNEYAGLLESRQQLYTVRHRLFNTSTSTGAAHTHVAQPLPASAPVLEEAIDAAPAAADMDNKSSDLSASAAAADVPAHAQLVYYIDAATPPGIREALVDGVNWWDAAFQAAGYAPGTFYATVIDRADFDPYDVHVPKRNFVEWIDRDLRSYSVGMRVADPRTGEILKGHVRIENLRMRQDALIAEALLGPFTHTGGSTSTSGSGGGHSSLLEALQGMVERGEGAVPGRSQAGEISALDTTQSNILRVIMQRVRQLGAHEVGHTLGLAHNFAGSTSATGYASVMDYPPPIVTLDATRSELVLNSKAYSTGIGASDKVSIRYGYKQLGNITAAQERAALDVLLQQAITHDGYVFLTDQDAAATSGDWRDTQWDAGNDPITALNTSLTVRALAMRKLQSNSVLVAYAPYSQLQELFPIVYLWHRYEVEACAKLVGGYTFQYDVRSGAASKLQGMQKPVPADKQLAAVRQLLVALHPSQLAVAGNLTQHLLPAAFGYSPDIGGVADLLPTRTGAGTFDIMAASEIGANLVISAIFSATRLERIAAQVLKDPSLSSLQQLLMLCSNTVFGLDYLTGAIRSAGRGESGLAALFALQIALVNAYLGIIAAPAAAHSFSVRRAVSNHIITVTWLLTDWSRGTDLCKTSSLGEDRCGTLMQEINDHCYGLRNAITAGKLIEDDLKTPLGPPI